MAYSTLRRSGPGPSAALHLYIPSCRVRLARCAGVASKVVLCLESNVSSGVQPTLGSTPSPHHARLHRYSPFLPHSTRPFVSHVSVFIPPPARGRAMQSSARFPNSAALHVNALFGSEPTGRRYCRSATHAPYDRSGTPMVLPRSTFSAPCSTSRSSLLPPAILTPAQNTI
jgi:hypothetical protein